MFTPQGLAPRNGSAVRAVAFVDFAEGADVESATEVARAALSNSIQVSIDAVQAHAALRPAELIDIDSARATANALAILLVASATIALGFTLSASVRRRQHQLAILSALGFDRRDLRRTIRWQTSVIAIGSLVVGLPLGVLAGRMCWIVFARQIGVTPSPTVPPISVLVIAFAFIALTLLAGELPARHASRLHPAAALQPLA